MSDYHFSQPTLKAGNVKFRSKIGFEAQDKTRLHKLLTECC